VQLQAVFVHRIQEKDKEKEEHFTSILFTFQKLYEEIFPKMDKITKNTLMSPQIYWKITPKLKNGINLKMMKNGQKLPIKFTFL
jgi:hypothetical protein